MYKRPIRPEGDEGWDSDSFSNALSSLKNMALQPLGEAEAKRIKDFVRISSLPTLGRSRVVEQVELQENYIKKIVRVEYRLDLLEQTEDNFHYIPLVRPSKGQLLNNFELKDGSGASMMTLSYGETTRLLAQAIHLLSQASLGEERLLADSSAPEMELDYLGRAILPPGKKKRAMTAESVRPDASTIENLEIDDFPQKTSAPSEAATGPAEPSESQKAGAAGQELPSSFLEHFVDQLKGVYPIVAIVPASLTLSSMEHTVLLLEYTYTVPVTRQLANSQGRLERFKNRLRTITVTPGPQVVVDASKSLRSDSYHLRVGSPAGYHVGDVLFIDKHTGKQVERETTPGLAFSRSHYRCLPSYGQPFAHLYTRFFSTDDAVEPRLIIRFYENLPGSLGKAAVLACITFLVVWLVAVGSPTRPGDSDALALVLAFPALVAAWLRFDERGQVLGTSLLARLSLISSVSLAMGSAFLYLAQTDARFGKKFTEFHLLFVYNPYWMVLVACAIVSAIVPTVGIIVRTLRAKAVHDRKKEYKEP